MEIKFGSTGNKVEHIQRALGLEVDGDFGRLTEAAVKSFQNKNGIYPSGIVDYDTYELLFTLDISTDLEESKNNLPSNYKITLNLLPKSEYIPEVTKKTSICLHHTAGWDNPYKTIEHWDNDKRGRIGTHYVIGGINPATGIDEFDGTILQAIPDDSWAFHLGISSINKKLEKSSISIELCNFGYLEKRGGDFYTWAGQKVHPDFVIELNKKFRGRKYWLSYSKKQIEALQALLIYLSDKHSIDLKKGLNSFLKTESEYEALGYKEDVLYSNQFEGLYSHTHVRRDKFDVYPHPDLIKMIKGL